MGRWTRGRTVGRGSSATVSMAVSCSSGEVFAVKSARMSESEPLQRERKILSTINSPYIVSYRGWDMTLEGAVLMFNLFMEYCPCGTMRDAINRRGGQLGEPDIARYTRQILAGMDCLHSRGISHCDIKPENILVAEDDAKISDFGCARRIEEPQGPIAGTPMFMAPEVVRGEAQGRLADVWSLGCTVIEMATGKAPWSGPSDPFLVMYRVGYSGESPEIPGSLSEEAKDFLGKCLRRDPGERWTVTQLLKHPFLARLSFPVSKQSEQPKSSSPTCVLDHGFWSSPSEESDPDSMVPEHTSMIKLVAGRIGQPSLSAGRQDWTREEEDWVFVRGISVTGETFCGSDWWQGHGRARN